MSATNAVFTGIFLTEMLLKWVAYQPLPYFRDNWNKLDFFIVLISVLVRQGGGRRGGL